MEDHRRVEAERQPPDDQRRRFDDGGKKIKFPAKKFEPGAAPLVRRQLAEVRPGQAGREAEEGRASSPSDAKSSRRDAQTSRRRRRL